MIQNKDLLDLLVTRLCSALVTAAPTFCMEDLRAPTGGGLAGSAGELGERGDWGDTGELGSESRILPL